MKITFLGTNGWYSTPTGNTQCILIESDSHCIILDAGNGFYKLDKYLKEGKPGILFLSHFHLDHILGLHTLTRLTFSGGLKIFGPKGTRDAIQILVDHPFSIPLRDLPFGVDVFELPEEGDKLPFQVECLELLHATLTLGYRLDLDGKIVAYCPDTGYCENAVRLARGADLLISECSFRPGESHSEWPHLSPQEASRIANEAAVKRLILTHFDASRYPTLDSREAARTVARETFANTIISVDDMQIEI